MGVHTRANRLFVFRFNNSRFFFCCYFTTQQHQLTSSASSPRPIMRYRPSTVASCRAPALLGDPSGRYRADKTCTASPSRRVPEKTLPNPKNTSEDVLHGVRAPRGSAAAGTATILEMKATTGVAWASQVSMAACWAVTPRWPCNGSVRSASGWAASPSSSRVRSLAAA